MKQVYRARAARLFLALRPSLSLATIGILVILVGYFVPVPSGLLPVVASLSATAAGIGLLAEYVVPSGWPWRFALGAAAVPLWVFFVMCCAYFASESPIHFEGVVASIEWFAGMAVATGVIAVFCFRQPPAGGHQAVAVDRPKTGSG